MLGGVWLLLGVATVGLSSCYGRNCEGSPRQFGLDASDGRMLDENTWESSPSDGEWLPFPRQTAYNLSLPFGGRRPEWWLGYVSGQQRPNTGNLTLGAGNLTVFNGVGPNALTVFNDTCSDYYIRVVAWAAPFGSSAAEAASPTDGGD